MTAGGCAAKADRRARGVHDALVAPPALSHQREAEMPWRSWPISATAMDSGAMDSASEREYESDCESDSSMPGLVTDSESEDLSSDSSADELELEQEPEPEPKQEPKPEPAHFDSILLSVLYTHFQSLLSAALTQFSSAPFTLIFSHLGGVLD